MGEHDSSTDSPTPTGTDAMGATVGHRSPFDQTKDAAKKVLALITGRTHN